MDPVNPLHNARFRKLFAAKLIATVFWCCPLLATADDLHHESGLSDRQQCIMPYGVVIDFRASRVFATTVDKGLQALNLSDGAVAWEVPVSGRPLASTESLLYTQTEPVQKQLGLAALSDIDGQMLHHWQVALPDGVHPIIDELPGQRFTLAATLSGDELHLDWEYTEQTFAAMPAEGLRAPPVLHKRGALVTGLDGNGNRQWMPGTGKGGPLETGRPGAPPWHSGAVLASLRQERSRTPAESRLTLLRKDRESGKPLPELVLRQGEWVAAVPSGDQRYIAVASRIRGQDQHWLQYRWEIFSLESGERGGSFSSHVSAGQFCVAGSVLFYITEPFGRRVEDKWISESLTLRAINLTSGNEVWNTVLRDTRHRGAPPPRR